MTKSKSEEILARTVKMGKQKNSILTACMPLSYPQLNPIKKGSTKCLYIGLQFANFIYAINYIMPLSVY
jgi:hypothetical protein